jgi:arylformamidase
MLLAAQWPRFAPDLPPKVVQGGLSVSGVFDAMPVMNTPSVNVDVRLDARMARRVSPAYLPPATDAPLYLAVGGKEQEGFHEQHRLMRERWSQVVAGEIPCPDDNHFTILERLADSRSPLFQRALVMMNAGG